MNNLNFILFFCYYKLKCKRSIDNLNTKMPIVLK